MRVHVYTSCMMTGNNNNSLLRSLHEARVERRKRSAPSGSSSSASVAGRSPRPAKMVRTVVDLTDDIDSSSSEALARARAHAPPVARVANGYRLLPRDALLNQVMQPLIKSWERSTDVQLRILTWNVADFDRESLVSKSAPASWSVEKNRAALLRLIRMTGADVVLLQECPASNFELCSLEFDQTKSCISHCGFIHAFVRRDEDAWQVESAKVLPSCPAIMLVLKKGEERIQVCTMHLQPGKDGGDIRKNQISSIAAAAAQEFPLIVAGDANMRNAEVKRVPSKLKAIKTPPTWDSRKNKYHGDGAFQFSCTFDRVFASSPSRVRNVKLVGQEELNHGGASWNLSDHYGVLFDICK